MENGQSWGTEQGADFDYIKNAIINIKKIEGIAEKIEEWVIDFKDRVKISQNI